MTSTITAEERAEALVSENEDCFSGCNIFEERDIKTLIAAAIRDAEQAAYERAAVLLEETGYPLGGGVMTHPAAAIAVRALKSPSPPKDQGHE